MGFFIGHDALGLAFIHQFMDLFGEIITVAEMWLFLDQRFDKAKKALLRIIFQKYFFLLLDVYPGNQKGK